MVEATINVQTLGIAISAFVATIAAVFLLINAWHETVARSFSYALIATAVWAWFGFFSALAADHGIMTVARELRIFSVIGNILLSAFYVRFAFFYKNDALPLSKYERALYDVFILTAAAFVILATADAAVGTSIIAGPFLPGTPTPVPGPFMFYFVLYYCACIAAIYVMMSRRIASIGPNERRAHAVLMFTLTIGATTGIAGFTTWFGIYSPALAVIRALAVPILTVGAFYSIHTQNIFNIRVAAVNFFVFCMWTLLFLRILLNDSFQAALPDIYLFVPIIALGVLLIHSFTKELDARVTLERVERQNAVEQAKSEFISIIAHQMRTPLSGIRWTFSVLADSASGLSADELDLVSKGEERTKDVIERVNEMLRAARFTSDAFELTFAVRDIRPLVKESVALFQHAAEARGLTLTVSVPRKVLKANIDRDKFSIALQNLVDNALKYTHTGSVNVAAELSGEDIVVRVSDTGIGIGETDRSHLFEKFYRNEEATKMFTDGSGLGLFIVKKIVDAHGGTIRAEPNVPVGTVFTMRLPVART